MDFLEEKKAEIVARLDELRPQHDEFNRLEAALSALEGAAPDPSARRGHSGRARRSSPARSAGRGKSPARRGRPKGSGTRAAEALALVEATPGITIPEIAQQMGIQQNYLYRVLPALEQDGKVRKEGRGWFPKAPSAAAAAA